MLSTLKWHVTYTIIQCHFNNKSVYTIHNAYYTTPLSPRVLLTDLLIFTPLPEVWIRRSLNKLSTITSPVIVIIGVDAYYCFKCVVRCQHASLRKLVIHPTAY